MQRGPQQYKAPHQNEKCHSMEMCPGTTLKISDAARRKPMVRLWNANSKTRA
jgi:hypothetical protein